MSEDIITHINAEIRSIEDLRLKETVQSLCLHRNLLSTLKGLPAITCLREANLSCNRISSILPLSSLRSLTSLNLADNALTDLENITTARNLKRLQVQHNKITTLRGLRTEAKSAFQLEHLDIRDNCFKSLLDLTHLVRLRLRCIYLDGEQKLRIKLTERLEEGRVRLAIAAILPKVQLVNGVELVEERAIVQKLQEDPRGRDALALRRFISQPLGAVTAKSQQQFTGGRSIPAAWTSQVLAQLSDLERGASETLSRGIEGLPGRCPVKSQAIEPDRADASIQTCHDPALDRLEADAQDLRQQLDLLGNSLQKRTSETEQANAMLQIARREADLKVAGIRLQANAAVRLAQKNHFEAQRDLQGSRRQTEEAKASARDFQRALDDLRKDLQTKEQSVLQVNVILEKALAEKAEAQQAIEASRHEIKALENGLRQQDQLVQEAAARGEARAAEEAAESLKAKGEWEKQLAEVRSALQEARSEAEVLSQEKGELREQSEKLRSSNEAAQAQISKLQAALDSLETVSKQREDARAALLDAENVAKKSEWEAKERRLQHEIQVLQETVEGLQNQAAASETRLQETVKEAEAELQTLQKERNHSAEETRKVKRALYAAAAAMKEKEQLLTNVTDMAQRQKSRLTAMQASNASLAAQLAATQPLQTARLQAEVMQLRETLGGLEVYKEQALHAQKTVHQLESEVKRLHQAREAATEDSKAAASAAEQRVNDVEKRCGERLKQALQQHTADGSLLKARLESAQQRVMVLERELQESNDAFKVKTAMVDSANASVSSLKGSLMSARDELMVCQKRLAQAESELRRRDSADSKKLHKLHAEVEELEAALLEAERTGEEAKGKAKEAELSSKEARAALKEKEEVVRYVTEEVDRVKLLFSQKEARLSRERDAAMQEALSATEECKRLNEHLTLLHGKLELLNSELEAGKARTHEATAEAEKHKQESAATAERLAKVESNTKQLMATLERQRTASAAKIQKLASVVQELQGL